MTHDWEVTVALIFGQKNPASVLLRLCKLFAVNPNMLHLSLAEVGIFNLYWGEKQSLTIYF